MTVWYFGQVVLAQLIVGLPSGRLYSALNILLPPQLPQPPLRPQWRERFKFLQKTRQVLLLQNVVSSFFSLTLVSSNLQIKSTLPQHMLNMVLTC